MIRYTKRYVNIISLIITALLFTFLVQINFIKNFNTHSISSVFKSDSVIVELSSSGINQDTEENNLIQNNAITENNSNLITNETYMLQNNQNTDNAKDNLWKIQIPKISLDASISEGTSKEIMDKYVGHFEETSLKSGNVGLAAHNRGYAVNYFANIKSLQEGDEIIYKYNDFIKTYIVEENKIIKDTDWKDLENTNENKITLITCVENEPEYRRCIQGVERKGGY